MAGKILTIIVPSYNTENYIDECIPTMLEHNWREELEILAINDGSKDHTLKKLREYEIKYPESVRVIDKSNGGHGSVINLGVKTAKGKYVKVVDGDDWVDTENLGKLIDTLKNIDADLVISPLIKFYVDKRRGVQHSFQIEKGRSLQFDEIGNTLDEVEIHAATYKTSIFRDNKVQVRENCYYDDTEYNIFPIPYVETVYATEEPIYYYRIGTQEQSINPKKAFQNRKMHQRIVEDCLQFYDENEKQFTKSKREYIKRIIYKRVRSQYMIYVKNDVTASNHRELMEWDLRLQQISPYFYREINSFPIRFLRSNKRFAYLLLHMLYYMYAKFVKQR